jgi:lysophospholipase L1-like esterase
MTFHEVVSMKKLATTAVLFLGLGLLAAIPSAPGQEARPYALRRDYTKWEKEVAAYEASDRQDLPPKNAILFIGSSTIRLWKTLAEDYPNVKVINRGFGGTEIVDSTRFADRLIFPHEPKQIFLRAGGNDIHAGRTPREVAADFAEFVRVVHARLPKTEIVYIGVSPAPSRWGESDKYRELNRLIREMALEMPRVGYVDTFNMVLGPDGNARPELFVKDRLHFSPEGYQRLRERVRPFLAQ